MKKQETPKPQSHIRVHLRSGSLLAVDIRAARPKLGSLLMKTVDANGWLSLPKMRRDYLIPKENIAYIEVLDTTGFTTVGDDENDD